MKEILQGIYHIQKLDDQIRSNQEQLDQVPKEIAKLQEYLRESKGRLDEVIKQQAEQSKQRKTLEQEVEQTVANIKKHQTQLLAVKTNKEYSTMLHEIEMEKKKISDLEEQILLIMESLDKLVLLEKEERKALQIVERDSLEKQKSIEQEGREAETKTEELKKAKQNLLANLPKDILSLYDKIGRARNGTAAVAVKNGACGGCYGNLPTQLLNRIKDMDRIITCENCGRILIWQDLKQSE